MSDPNGEFDFPKLRDALQAAFTHRAAVPASVDDAIRVAARERFGRRRRLRLIARWGTGLAAGVAAAIVLIVSPHRPAPLGPVGFDRQMTMIDALNLAKHLAAKESIDKSWDMNHDGVIDQKDIDAVAALSVNIGPRVLGQHTLPTLQQLGIAHPVALASDFGERSRVASETTGEPKTVALSKPKPAEVPQ
jgi:hypothetical protein